MVFDQIDPYPMDDESTVHGAMTPPETVVTFLDEQDPLTPYKPTSSVPCPGQTFIIRSSESGHVLTLLDGRLVLAPHGWKGSIHWACVENKGWLGFRNTVSGRFLGHDNKGKLRCEADRHQHWENFCVRPMPDGGYILQMTHYERLWKVGRLLEKGEERLAKVGEGKDDGMVWEFIKV